MLKSESLELLYDKYRLEFAENEVVTGDGNIDAKVLLVGEAPGKDEVRLGRPFVGAAGKNLDEFLSLLQIGRNDIYITNAIKYRLSRINPQSGRVVNRPATKDEITGSRKYLLDEIALLNAPVIVTLGNVPLKSVTGDFNMSIGDVHGKPVKLEIADGSYTLFPLYHPASVIYNSSLKSVYINDIKKLGEYITAQRIHE